MSSFHKNKLSILWHHYIWPYKLKMFFMILALLGSSGSILLLSRGARFMVDYGFHDTRALHISILQFIILGATLSLCTAVRAFMIGNVSENIAAELRKRIYHKILHFKPLFFTNYKQGELISKLTTDITEFQESFSNGLSVGLRNLVLCVGAIVMLLLISSKLTLILLLAVLFIALPINFIRRYYKQIRVQSNESVASIISSTEESINSIKTIQACIEEKNAYHTFSAKIHNVLNAQSQRVAFKSFLTFTVMFSSLVALASVIHLGADEVNSGLISSGNFASFLFLGILAAFSVPSLVESFFSLLKSASAVWRVEEFLSMNDHHLVYGEQVNDLQTFRVPMVEGELLPDYAIKFKNVTFSYGIDGNDEFDQPPMLNDNVNVERSSSISDVSFVIPKGKLTAIVGHSGAGKSTIFQLLLRFYDVEAGKIFIEGMDITTMPIKMTRAKFAYAGTESFIFAGSIKDNILYGNHDITKDEMLKAIKAAALDTMIANLPEGIDTFVGEKGLALSNGERQRIIIARALLRNADTLLLDEATSALDLHTEMRVKQGIMDLMSGCTRVVIAHRLSTFIEADNIIVLHNGKVVGQGTHEELLADNNPYYTELYSREIQ